MKIGIATRGDGVREDLIAVREDLIAFEEQIEAGHKRLGVPETEEPPTTAKLYRIEEQLVRAEACIQHIQNRVQKAWEADLDTIEVKVKAALESLLDVEGRV